MSIIITGANGFVGSNIIYKLKNKFKGNKIIALHRGNLANKLKGVNYQKVDLSFIDEIIKIIDNCSPEYIIHLAAESSVAFSWKEPVKSFNNNINIYLNLIEAVRQSKFNPTILSVGSSEVYGNTKKIKLPFKESSKINPINPYSVARASQEAISKVYTEGYGLKIIMTRSFNHIGIEQDLRFFIPSVINQLFDSNSTSLYLGNLEIVRDYIDIDDVTDAYLELLDKGVPGEVYNVCSGIGYTLKEVVDIIMNTSNIFKDISINESVIRPNDNIYIVGDNTKIKKLTGWKPKFSLEMSLDKIIMNKKRLNS
jgi:GDP-4-dehydro-6-deoxy-D-mannose reductase